MQECTFCPDEAAEQQPSPSVRVLLVDDYEPWRRWVYAELGKQQQFQIMGEASDGLEGARKACELKPDLILLDVGLPNLNGLEAAKRIAQSTPNSKIILLTQQNDPYIVKHAMSNGVMGYVLKTDADTDLLAVIAAVLQGQRLVSRQCNYHLTIATARKTVPWSSGASRSGELRN